MWLINFLPAWLFDVITVLTAIALFVSILLSDIIPSAYRIPAQIAAGVVLAVCLYFQGGIANEETWKIKVAETQKEIADLKQKQAETTVEVVTKYVDRIKVVKEKADVIVKEVPKYITQADNDRCVLPDSVRMLHDAAVEQGFSQSTRNADEKTSGSEKAGEK